ncbi:DUF4344 domain-containing metallopeptidase [Veronia pacifica]|uniref:Metallopeptidase DUF4344 n=1 Tax=Veronia pacifica TaxID=1080227 RepID=A0A1C3EQ38_9GAMM|nr:DUF4344 domain-containing metallopeptidase [Veronia pacifica]ODA35335.1 hypothetical protein A8L45_03985 [Veronia pacifica]
MLKTIKSLLLILLCQASIAYGKTQLTVTPPKDEQQRTALEFAKPIANTLITLVNEEYPLYQTLTLTLGGDDGPLFDPEQMQILIPYAFINEVQRRFRSPDAVLEKGVSVQDASRYGLIHVMLHEFGHALVFDHDIPILGKEEDAVDTFATLIMIWHQKTDHAFAAAELFALHDLEVDEFNESDFWGEHSLDAQRYASALCLIYGSDPEKYSNLINEELAGEERESYCQEEFENQSRNWERIIDMARVFKNQMK